MVVAGTAHGFLVVFLSCFCYGTYFVPAKKYEIHDGLVFQWYQCSGIMLAGIVIALLRNNWNVPGESSPGFYVAPEGLLSGLLFQVANIIATVSVKKCGLGNYYTVHQVTNLGVTFVVGVFGPRMGLPATPPHRIGLAAAGFCLVLLGMIPIMCMEKRPPEQEHGGVRAPTSCEAPAAAVEPLGLPSPNPSRLDLLFAQEPPAVSEGTAGAASSPADRSRMRQPSLGFRRLSLPANCNFRAFNSWTWDGAGGPPRLGFDPDDPVGPLESLEALGCQALVIKEVSTPEMGTPRESVAGGVAEPFLQAQEPQQQWLKGILLSLVAGALYASIYIPLLPWKARLQAQGVVIQGFDSFFSMCVGLYICSTAWLLCGGAWKKYRGQRMDKSVLRPALISGMIYAVGSCSFLIAMVILPYAIGYALGVGGGLAVSLLWSTLVFGEAASPQNRRCVACSFAGVLCGIVLLGLSS